jgi:PAT family beta-lactamase induction signal transducer AmpG
MLTGNGLIVIIGGYLEQEYGDKESMVLHHDYCRSYYGCLNHLQFFLHLEQKTPKQGREIVGTQSKFWSRLCQFFQKKQIGIVLAFIIPLGESVTKNADPFPY